MLGKFILNPSLGNGKQLEGGSKRMIPAEQPSITRHHHPDKSHYGDMRVSIYRILMRCMGGGSPRSSGFKIN